MMGRSDALAGTASLRPHTPQTVFLQMCKSREPSLNPRSHESTTPHDALRIEAHFRKV